jgi:multiple sugar transport system substrate-binding protein
MTETGHTDISSRLSDTHKQRVDRRRSRVRLWAVAAASLALLAAACGSTSGSSSSAGSASSGSAAQGKHTLVVWEFWSTAFPGLTKLEQKLNAEFEAQNPQYKIQDVPISFTQLGPKLTAAISAGTGPNVVSVFPGVAGAAYRNGLIPLQSYLTASDRQNWRLLNEAAGPGGGIYAIPWTEYGYFVYYNKALFAKAGLNPNAPPTTWPAFMTDLQALKAHSITAISGGFKDGYEWEWWAFPLLDQLMSPTATKSFDEYNYPITSPVFSTVWSDVKGLGPYFASDAAGLNLYNDAYDNFDAGKAAMVLDAPTLSNLVTAQHDLGTKNVGVFPVPRLATSQYPSFVDAGPEGGWGITKWTTDRTGAWAYINWMESKQAQDLMWSESHLIPNNAQTTTPTSNAAIATVLNDLKNPENHTIYLGFPVSVLAINERYASEMITGQTSTSSVLQQMEQLRQQLKPKITGGVG